MFVAAVLALAPPHLTSRPAPQSLHLPSRPARTTAYMAYPAAVGEILMDRFKKDVGDRDGEVDALFAALVQAYGSEELALAAGRQNPQIINPTYTSPPGLVGRSKAALVEAMGSEAAAIEVMRLNPAVLQCGKSLRGRGAEEIKTFANVRAFADGVPPAVSQGLTAAVIALCLVGVVAKRVDAPAAAALSDAIGPLLGATFAPIFLFTAYATSQRAPKKEVEDEA